MALRRARPTLSLGSYAELDSGASVLGYVRARDGMRDVVLLNLGARRERVSMPELAGQKLLLSTHVDRSGGAFDGTLEPDEAVVLGT